MPERLDAITGSELEKGLSKVVKDGLTTQAMSVLTGGIFLTAFALALGANNLVIGLIAAIPAFAQLAQVPTVYLVERYRTRRRICVYASAISRIFWLVIAVIPFVVPPGAVIPVLVGAICMNAVFGSIGGCSWNSWMRDLVPTDRLGSFFSRRLFLATILGIGLSWAAGVFIDGWDTQSLFPPVYGYSVLFLLAFFAGMIGVIFLSSTPEPCLVRRREDLPFHRRILLPFADTNFRRLIRFMGCWNFAVNLATPFFTVFMIQVLDLDLSVIVALSILSQLMHCAFLQIWGSLSDRFSNKSILGVCCPLFLVSIFAWTFTVIPDQRLFSIPLLAAIHLLSGIAGAGITLASSNIALKLAPSGQATAFLAGNAMMNSLAAGIAPVIGGIIADVFADRQLMWTLTWTSSAGTASFETLHLEHWGFLFFFASVLGVYALYRLKSVAESGEAPREVVVKELVTCVRQSVRDRTPLRRVWSLVTSTLCLLQTTDPRRRKSE